MLTALLPSVEHCILIGIIIVPHYLYLLYVQETICSYDPKLQTLNSRRRSRVA